jgi:hypothetical protein
MGDVRTWKIVVYVGKSPGLAYGIDTLAVRGDLAHAEASARDWIDQHAGRLGVAVDDFTSKITPWESASDG